MTPFEGRTDVDTVKGALLEVTGIAGVTDTGILFGHVGRGDLGFHCLQFIDPYCGGFLNALQMGPLRHDLTIITRASRHDDDRRLLERLDELSRIVEGATNLLMSFKGD